LATCSPGANYKINTSKNEKQQHAYKVNKKQGSFHNSIQFFIIYVPSQQPKGQLQTQHSLYTGKYSLDTGKSKLKTSIG
jgi:hypothetical protein